jgi:hypothetical protein
MSNEIVDINWKRKESILICKKSVIAELELT